ncbi:GNAT family N-acetyltransferase [Nocardia sp. CA-129566]|uniref:GNAT family N-acetyltransferase n=1 Tax=Nocardia sp. CA-129566 TaxID=3239976 RepID=UPI003D95BEBD
MGTRLLFVAEHGDRVVGCAGIITETEPPTVVSVWVNPCARGRGTSDLLLAATINWARELGHHHLRLCVIVGNQHAERLYLRTGFTFTGCEQRCADDDPRMEREMVIALASEPPHPTPHQGRG